MTKLLLPLLLIFSYFSGAEVYRSIDANGNVTFTDSPSQGENATPVEVQEPNSIRLRDNRANIYDRLNKNEEEKKESSDIDSETSSSAGEEEKFCTEH